MWRHAMKGTTTVAMVLFMTATVASAAQWLDPVLMEQVNAEPAALTAVAITYDHRPAGADIARLQWLGVPGGVVLEKLPMILTGVTKLQLDALRGQSGIVA